MARVIVWDPRGDGASDLLSDNAAELEAFADDSARGASKLQASQWFSRSQCARTPTVRAAASRRLAVLGESLRRHQAGDRTGGGAQPDQA
jgi:hypothetical protein